MTRNGDTSRRSSLPEEMRGDFLYRFLDQLDEVVVILDEERRIAWSNRAANSKFRLDMSDLVGKLMGEAIGCIHSEDAGCGASTWCPCGISARIEDAQTCAAEAMRENISIPVRTEKAIEVRNFLITAMPLTLDGDGFPKVCLLIDDRTQLVRRTDEIGILSSKLERRALQVESMTETILHDLKAPLLSIISSLAPKGNDSPSSEVLFEIGNLRLAIENLLRVSQMDTEGFPLAKEVVDPAAVLSETVGLMRNEPLPAGTTFDLSAPEGIVPSVSADRKVLAMVIENLARNLIAGQEGGGKVSVGVEPRGQSSVQIWIKGEGNPIAEDLLDSIFDPEFHLKRPDSGGRRNKGLPFCKMAMIAQGGDVTADILDDGNLTFRVTLAVRRKTTGKV